MRSFFKSFFAALLALIVFTVIAIFVTIGWAVGKVSRSQPSLGSQAVLYLDLSTPFQEQGRKDDLANLFGKEDASTPGLFEAVRLIRYAQSDSAVKGIFLRCEGNANGYASSQELRHALQDFKASGKFIYAYGDVISQKAYYVACVADRIYCNPAGSMEWAGLSTEVMFIKHTLDKLGIEPQIFYDGKFKSATEPLRTDKMSDANRLQTGEWLGDLNRGLLEAAAEARHLDTATVDGLQQTGAIQTAYDAVKNHLIDGLCYREDVLNRVRAKLGLGAKADINFISISKYDQAVSLDNTDKDRVAVIYAQGDIVYGAGEEGQIGSDEYIKWIRKARADDHVKAIVLRVNSPGGSSLASDIILRELQEARKAGKPIVVSMGDLAASGGYYISCGADSIFAEPGTLTGSIGVFSIIPNLQGFFKDKLGITFDGVKTAPFADAGNISRPLTDQEKHFFQANVDSTYLAFKTNVSQGRRLSSDAVETIAQGRVWTGQRALANGLVDRLGHIQDAVDCAARLAHLKQYGITEYPEAKSAFERYLRSYTKGVSAKAVKEELGPDGAQLLERIRRVKAMVGQVEVRLPYDVDIR
ncbi:MAG TPA: signal peptide peptidase SppA [Dinghuibacter sp.]|uniref:signal peptide peptidase SppA n=1 Tax=Dinghuibacter sp. TaxID=2024697 RepID=UPI002B76AED1|nr:signal peptide peptidase SppA [Dinghuibacter sp.]HTJ10441.1 signal peptide peptidase SppA [Dinghuibacter sp.]